MNDTLIITLIFVAVALGIGFSIFTYFKRRNEHWTGTVADKDIQTVQRSQNRHMNTGSAPTIQIGGNNQVQYNYYIWVDADGGKRIKRKVSHGFYEQVAIGDKLEKKPGSTTPEITQKSMTQPQPATGQQPPVHPGVIPQQPQGGIPDVPGTVQNNAPQLNTMAQNPQTFTPQQPQPPEPSQQPPGQQPSPPATPQQ